MIMQDALKRKLVEAKSKADNTAVQFKVVSDGPATFNTVRDDGAGDGKQHTEETLAPKQIEGVSADGHRNTTTIPAGAIGNEQPIKIVSEEWTSPDLGVRPDRPQGSSQRRIVVSAGEHPPRRTGCISLFPGRKLDYTIKEAGIRRLEQK